MRKSILPHPDADAPSPSSSEWLDLDELASVEISSEDPHIRLRMLCQEAKAAAGEPPPRDRSSFA